MKIIITEKQLNLLTELTEKPIPGSKDAAWIAKGINDLMNNRVFNKREKFLKNYFDKINDKNTLKYTIEILKNTFKKDFYGIINILNFSPKDKKYINSRITNIQLGKNLTPQKVKKTLRKDPTKMVASPQLYKFLRNEEGVKGNPELIAYQKKGDVPTIGYGHTLNVKLGQKITKEQAEKFLKEDVAVAEKCVRNIFIKWRSENIKIDLTQSMFDSLVSLVFNAGCGSLWRSGDELVDSIKKKKFHQIPNKIKNYKSQKKGFSGLGSRRERESAMFCKEGGCEPTSKGIS